MILSESIRSGEVMLEDKIFLFIYICVYFCMCEKY